VKRRPSRWWLPWVLVLTAGRAVIEAMERVVIEVPSREYRQRHPVLAWFVEFAAFVALCTAMAVLIGVIGLILLGPRIY